MDSARRVQGAGARVAREREGEILVLRLESPPLNALGPELLGALRGAVRDACADPEIAAMVIAGGASHFSAGADVGLFEAVAGEADAVALSRMFQEAFDEIEASGKPVVVAVAGQVMGGALELALACHGRVCAEGARLAMPEVNLGINPGAGGTQRLPRLIGARAALGMLLSGEPVPAAGALEAGLVDVVVPGERLIGAAVGLARAMGAPSRTSARGERIADRAEVDAAFAWAEERLRGVREELVAPGEIARAVRAGIEGSFAEGLKAEREAFARCMGTRGTRNKIYLFFATRAVAKIPELAGIDPVECRRAAVVGMGTMGSGIAQALLLGGLEVVALDESEESLARGVERIRESIMGGVRRGRTTEARAGELLARLHPARDWGALAGVQVAVEAIWEDPAAKGAVLGRLEEACGEGAILATNTSTLSLERLADGLRVPGRFVGMHFFNPAHRMPLVEVGRHRGAEPRALASVVALARRLRKTPVLVGDREGFVVNRLFIPYLKEAFWLLEEGAAPGEIDAAMVDFGLPMGPLALIDMAGLDILAATDRVLRGAFPRHGPLSAIVEGLVGVGYAGQKSGAGVYRYDAGDRTPREREETAALAARARGISGREARRIDVAEIRERLVMRMVAEASYLMAEGVARGEADIDVATVLGIGFPDFRGGVARYARDLGEGVVRERLARLVDRCGERFRLCETQD